MVEIARYLVLVQYYFSKTKGSSTREISFNTAAVVGLHSLFQKNCLHPVTNYLIKAILSQNETRDESQLTPKYSSQGQGKPTTKPEAQFSVYEFPETCVLFCKFLTWINLLSFSNKVHILVTYLQRGFWIREKKFPNEIRNLEFQNIYINNGNVWCTD